MTEIVTGTDVIKAALRARIPKGSSAVLARDIGCANDLIDSFARGHKATLPDRFVVLARRPTPFLYVNCLRKGRRR